MNFGPRDRELVEGSSLGQLDGAGSHSPMPSAEPSAQWLTVALEEYKALRVEIVDAIQAQRQIMQIGITGLSVLVGFGLQHINPLLAALLLIILVPLLAIFITAGALGEFFRATRESSFLAYREGVINRFIPGPGSGLPLALAQEWEQWLRRNREYTVRDWAQFLAVSCINTGALVLGFYTILASGSRIDQPFIFALGIVGTALWAINPIFYVYLLGRVRRQFNQKDLPRQD